MEKTKMLITFLAIAILFVSSLGGTIIFYNGVINNKDSEINILKSEISNLTAEVINLTSAHLVTDLNATIVPNNSPLVQMFPALAISVPFDSFWINGSVTNLGYVTAYDVGLYIVAFDGGVRINMTVPLISAVFGTDNATMEFIMDHAGYVATVDGGFGHGSDVPVGSLPLGQTGSLQLGTLNVGQTANFRLAIYHEGSVYNWTITPVWANTK